MKKRIVGALNLFLHRIGIDLQVSRFPVFETLGEYLQRLGIEVVIDVGANEGQFAEEIRSNGFHGRIISFEPQSRVFATLQAKAARDKNWECHQFALGDTNGTSMLHLSKNSVFSSLLKLSDSAGEIGYDAGSDSEETITIKTLDTVWPTLGCDRRCTLLKIDTQGFDLAVLRGARQSHPHLQAVQLEVPLRSMYDGQPTVGEMLPVLRGMGFHLVELTKVCRASVTGELLEMDGLFVRTAKNVTPPGD